MTSGLSIAYGMEQRSAGQAKSTVSARSKHKNVAKYVICMVIFPTQKKGFNSIT